MDNVFRLVKAIFFLVLAILMLVMAGLFGQNTVIAVIGVYGAFILGMIGIGVGSFAILDYKKEREETRE